MLFMIHTSIQIKLLRNFSYLFCSDEFCHWPCIFHLHTEETYKLVFLSFSKISNEDSLKEHVSTSGHK